MRGAKKGFPFSGGPPHLLGVGDPTMERTTDRMPGFRTFLVIWGGQVASFFGSGLTSFALGVWVYEQTGRATQFALMGFFSSLPAIVVSPLAGALVDRWNRRWAMILSDSGSAVVTLLLAGLLLAGRLELSHLYLGMAIASLFSAFQWPAWWATTTLLVPKDQLGRASGFDQFGQAASQFLAPAAAGLLIGAIGIGGVMLVDLGTYAVALATLLAVRVPRPAPAGEAVAGRTPSLFAQAKVGWRFIVDRPGLRYLLLYLAMINLLAGFNMALATPLVLSMGSPAELGVVLSVSSAGLLAGSFAMGAHGGPKRRMAGVLGFGLLYGLGFVLIGFATSLPAIAAASFLLMFCVPIINGCSQTIWQTKVPPGMQGRVFAVRRMIAQATLPLAFLLAGPLADSWFQPLMAEGSALAASVGRILGAGESRGIGLLYLVLGALALATSASAFLSNRFQRLEDELPDHVEVLAGEIQGNEQSQFS
jgi:DHA3 family macrolide efflux protein-like MFS transporter